MQEQTESINNRLKIARDRCGFDQAEFAKLIGYTPSGWAKVEQGQRKLSTEMLQEANQILNLDIRYFFGIIPFEEAKENENYSIKDLIKTVNQVSEQGASYSTKEDPILQRVRINKNLYDLVKKIAFLSGDVLDKLSAYLDGFLAGKELSSDERETKRKQA